MKGGALSYRSLTLVAIILLAWAPNVLGLNTGQALEGPLKGIRLNRLNHVDTFWFAWAAFKPQTLVLR